jgi:hypothetical protein
MKEKEKLRTIGMEDIGKEQIWKSSSRGEEKHVSSPIFSWPLLLDTCLKTPTPNSLQQFLLYIYHYFYFLLYFTTPLQKNPPKQKSSPTISYRAPPVYSCIFYSLWEQGYNLQAKEEKEAPKNNRDERHHERNEIIQFWRCNQIAHAYLQIPLFGLPCLRQLE